MEPVIMMNPEQGFVLLTQRCVVAPYFGVSLAATEVIAKPAQDGKVAVSVQLRHLSLLFLGLN